MSHPAFKVICSALTKESYTSGICEISTEQCGLYYRDRTADKDTVSHYLNLATATEDELSRLISFSDAAPFGRGNETVLDDTYRKAHKLDVSQFSTVFDLAGTPILNKVSQDLVDMTVSLKRAVRAERYKLNIYDKGGFFKPHQDTPRAENMFGSLVIVFPTPHEGGTLILRDGDVEWTFDAARLLASATPEAPKVTYVAFYSDLEHEVTPVVSGSRVTLTYNLYFDDMATVVAPIITSQGKDQTIKDGFQQLLDDTTFLPKGGRLAFNLSHSYPLKHDVSVGHQVSSLWRYLKGTDALIYGACRELGLKVMLRVFYEFDDDAGSTYLCRSFVRDDYGGEYSDDDTYIQENGDIDFPDSDYDTEGEDEHDGSDNGEKKGANARVLWVREGTTNNAASSTFVHYGNEHSATFIYGYVCLIVDFRRPSNVVEEGEEDNLEGEEVDSEGNKVDSEGGEVKADDEQ
ncbi:hypothetical protein BDZ89DRAFT_1140493 [Hymenopellis radicata]|nr:hypothetical protein BDZ89DRAFT_1140493 [Hymenopellis radicata]